MKSRTTRKINLKPHFFKILLIIFILTSCSSVYRPSESFEAKMGRYNSKYKNPNTVPFEIQTHLTASIIKKASRGPASIRKPKRSMRIYTDYSTKKLYFLSLYSQYRDLKKFSNKRMNTINICPNFHTSVVTYEDTYSTKSTNKTPLISSNYKINMNQINNYNYIQRHPELFLPIGEENRPTVYDILKNKPHENPSKLVQIALNKHLNKTYKELYELCETGSSENYYLFENLVNWGRREKKFKRPKLQAIKTLLKTTIYSNQAIVSSLSKIIKTNMRSGRSIASTKSSYVNNYQKELTYRLDSDWIESFYENLGE